MLSPDVIKLLHGGVAVVVATRDDELRPELARGWGPHISGDGRSVSLCVEAPEASAALDNLKGNGAIALTASPPTIATAAR